MIAPPRILITSDENIIELQRTVKIKNKEEVYVYKFIKSFSKKDVEFEITPENLSKQLGNFFKAV